MTSQRSPLPGIKVMLIGGTGTGKTTAIKTLIEAGVTPMCVFTEPSFDVLGDIPADRLHWHYISPMADTMEGLRSMVRNIGMMSYEQLTKMQDPHRSANNMVLPMYDLLMDYKCQRTGKAFGNVGTWGTDRALVIDSLSGLSKAAVAAVVGDRPAMSPPDYMVAQSIVGKFIDFMCVSLHCHFVLTAHAERETDPAFGGTKIMASAIGRALSPILPRNFTDVILTKRNGTTFVWDTADPQADLKARNAPISATLPPSFVPLLAAWRKRGGVIESPQAAS